MNNNKHNPIGYRAPIFLVDEDHNRVHGYVSGSYVPTPRRSRRAEAMMAIACAVLFVALYLYVVLIR